MTSSHHAPGSFQESGTLPDISELAHIGHEAMVISNFDFTKREEPVLWASPPEAILRAPKVSSQLEEETIREQKSLVYKRH